MRDSQLGDERVHDIANYIQKGKIWEAFASDDQPVLLIDEIDKADIEFPNDLLRELDRMEFYVYETQRLVAATRKNYPMRSCAAASSTTSNSRTRTRWRGLWTYTIRI